MPVPDYTIVVPSRKRMHTMGTIQYLLPTAKICIDEREVDNYAPFVAREKMLIHPPFEGLHAAINWMMEEVKSEVLVEVDDDFQGVQVNVGSKRFITDADQIRAIIENSMICCKDLGLTSFCWARTRNTAVIRPNTKPFSASQSVCNAFGVMGAARHRHYDGQFMGRGDVDWTLRTLLEDRCILADTRFYFDCGLVFGGRGGNVGLVTPEVFKQSSLALMHKWGRNVSFKKLGFQKNRDVTAIRIAVTRTNKTAQR